MVRKTRVETRDTPRIKELKYRARNYSIKEGIFASVKSSLGDYYISPFAVAINMSNSLIALLSSISGLLGPLSQMFSSKLMEKYSRKKIILKTVFLESLIWLPLIAIALLFHKGVISNILPLLLLFFFSIYTILANITSPAWFSWVGDIVNSRYRGRWFSKRNLILGFVSAILAIFASFFLDYFKRNGLAMVGFAVLFLFAFVGRIYSWKTFRKQYEPEINLKKGYYFSFWEFLVKAKENNFGRFTIFRALFSFTCSISSPFLVVYLLKNLEFSYSIYMVVTLSGTIFSLLVLELWGKIADKYGNYKVLYTSSVALPAIPLLWIIHPSPMYLILIPSIIGGIAWAGFNLASGNFIYDNVSQQKRGLAISYYNMLNGIGIFFGAGLGALLIKFLKTEFISPIFLIFIIGTIARTIIAVWWIPKIKEIKQTKKFDSSKILKNLNLKNAKITIAEELHEIISIKKYLWKR